MVSQLVRIDDLSLDQIDELTDRARWFERGGTAALPTFRAAMVFLTSSLRTRVGFTTAALRLGGSVVDVHEPRYTDQMSAPESVSDLLRTVSGMVDVTVMRSSISVDDLDLDTYCASSFVNAGDPQHHPTQALIDNWAIEEELGPLGDLHIVMLGDATMRAARSLLQLFRRRPPGRLTLVGPQSRLDHGIELGGLGEVTGIGTLDDVRSGDVVYVVGLPPKRDDDHLTDEQRREFQLTTEVLTGAHEHAVVLCPLPVVDEIDDSARRDPRIRFWAQSDRSVSMRMAVLEHVTNSSIAR